jgi:hypothetical protein
MKLLMDLSILVIYHSSPNRSRFNAFVIKIPASVFCRNWQVDSKIMRAFEKPRIAKTIFFFFGGSGDWHQDLVLAKQALYHLSHSLSPFCLSYLSNRVSLVCQAGRGHDLPGISPGMAGTTDTLLLWVATSRNGVSQTFLPRLALNIAPDFSFWAARITSVRHCDQLTILFY